MNATSPLSYLIQLLDTYEEAKVSYEQVLASVIQIYGLSKKQGEMLDSEYRDFYKVEARFSRF